MPPACFPRWARSDTASRIRLPAGSATRNAFPLVIVQGPEHVGFAMVARGSSLPAQPQIDYRMAEFFIARTRRRLGIGRVAVQLILNRFAGRWEISEFQRNTSAVSFWRRVVAAYTHGKYQERLLNGEVRQVFSPARTVQL